MHRQAVDGYQHDAHYIAYTPMLCAIQPAIGGCKINSRLASQLMFRYDLGTNTKYGVLHLRYIEVVRASCFHEEGGI